LPDRCDPSASAFAKAEATLSAVTALLSKDWCPLLLTGALPLPAPPSTATAAAGAVLCRRNTSGVRVRNNALSFRFSRGKYGPRGLQRKGEETRRPPAFSQNGRGCLPV